MGPTVAPLQLPKIAEIDEGEARKRAEQVARKFVQTDAELERVRSLKDETLLRVFQV